MGTVLLVLVVVLVIAGLVYGVVTLLAGDDPGLSSSDPDGRARPLPNNRSLTEYDLKAVRFDVALRGYRMTQVDRVLRRTAYDIGYKDEMIAVLEAEVIALREGRAEDAELLRKAREAAAAPPPPAPDRAPGAHRAPEPSEDTQPAGDAATEPPDVDEPEDPALAATAPGLLNRAALRRVEDPSSDTAAALDVAGSSDPTASPDTTADGPAPGGTDSTGSADSTSSADPAGSTNDPVSEAQRRART